MNPLGLREALEDRYQLEEQVASGGMAGIWRATDLQTRETVAVKILQISDDPRRQEDDPGRRILREADVLQRLTHPNIVNHRSSGLTPDGFPYLVLEWLGGEDLAQRQQRLPLELDQVVEVGLQALAGLAGCHAAGVVHRDIKPRNLFIVEGERLTLKLIDFSATWIEDGSATRLTETGVVMGSVHYLAPEQVVHRLTVDRRTDIYALGVVLYELITRRRPFRGDDPLAVILKIISETPPLPSLHRPGVPAGLEDVVLWAMMRAPADRFQSAEEMRDALIQSRSSGRG